jgi:CelD/BcsL family acetyltransferase involved in cellulose biosynthesis
VRRKAIYRRLSLREIAFVGSGRAAPDHLDIVATPGAEAAVAEATVDCLGRHRLRFDILRLEAVRAESVLLARLADRFGPAARVVDEVCPYVELPATWDEYLARRSRDLRHSLRRRARRLEEDHEAIVYRQVDDQASLEQAMQSLVALHSAGFPEGAFADRDFDRFHRLSARRFLQAGWLRLYLLTVDEHDAAALYGFAYGGRFWSYISGYDHALTRYSTSSQLFAYAIRRSIEDGLTQFDFLRGDEKYKFDWADCRRLDANVTVPARTGGRAVLRGLRLLRG